MKIFAVITADEKYEDAILRLTLGYKPRLCKLTLYDNKGVVKEATVKAENNIDAFYILMIH